MAALSIGSIAIGSLGSNSIGNLDFLGVAISLVMTEYCYW